MKSNKILIIGDWKDSEMNQLNYFQNEKLSIWNCKRKIIFKSRFIQRYYEYLFAIIFYLKSHKKYDYIIFWQQILGYVVSFLFPSSLTKKTIISTILYSPKNTNKYGLKRLFLKISLKKSLALLYFSEGMASDSKENFHRYSNKIYSTLIPIIDKNNKIDEITKFDNLYDLEKTIFCGGQSDRDFDTVIMAFRNTNTPVIICCPDDYVISKIDLITKNIKVLRFSEVSPSEYYGLIIKSFCVVISLKSEYSSCGQLLFSFCMKNSIPIIASNCFGTRDYITNNENGLLVPINDSKSINKAYKKLIENKEFRTELVNKSKEISNKMNFKNYLEKINQIINDESITYN